MKKNFFNRTGTNINRGTWASEISQKELTEQAFLYFIYLSNTERGERNISLVNMAKLRKVLVIFIKDLMSR